MPETRRRKRQPTPTPAAQWRQEAAESELVTLPSGHRARLRVPDLVDLALSGMIPDSITPRVQDLFMGHITQQEFEAGLNMEEIGGLVTATCLGAFVEPRVYASPPSDPPDDNWILLEHISGDDKLFVFNWALGDAGARGQEVEQLATFPDGSTGETVAVAPDGQGVLPEAE